MLAALLGLVSAAMVRAQGAPPGPEHAAGVFLNGFEGYQVYRIPAIVRLRGSLLAFAEARRHGADEDHIDLAMKESVDGGRTWSGLRIVVGNPSGAYQTAHGNPVPIADEETGLLHLVYCVNNTYVFHTVSVDVGQHWSSPRNITSMVKRPSWGWFATGPNHGLRLRSGRLVVPFNTFPLNTKVVSDVHQTSCAGVSECSSYHGAGTLKLKYKVHNTADDTDATLSGVAEGLTAPPPFGWAGDRSGVFYSDDLGSTWREGGQIVDFPGSSECVIEELESGNGDSQLLLSFRVEDNMAGGCRHMARSNDGGGKFDPFFKPLTCIPDPTCQGSLLSLGGGDVVITSGPGSRTQRVDMMIHMSLDQGATFEPLLQVNNGTAGYSDLVRIAGTSAGWSVGVLLETSGGLTFAAFHVARPHPREADFNSQVIV